MKILAIISILFVAVAARTAFFCEVPTTIDNAIETPLLRFSPSGTGYDWSNFNFISFDTLYCPSGDIEGRAAVKNSINVDHFSVGYELKTGGVSAIDNSLPFSFVVGGDATFAGGAVLPDGSGFPYTGPKENLFVGGTLTAPAYLQTSRTGGPASLASSFEASQLYFNSLSDAFASMSANIFPTIQPWGTISFTCPSTNAQRWVLEISPSDFSKITFWEVSGCNAESTFLINIRGAGNQVKFAGATQTFIKAERIVYNVVGSSSTPSVRVEVGINGNLLAPRSQYNQPGLGVFIGQVVVANAQQILQINRVNCRPPADQPESHPCVGFETECAGLDFTLGGSSVSFKQFNAISFGEFHADTGDIQGRLAVKGSVTLGNGYSIGAELQTFNNLPYMSLPFSLIVGGDLTWGSGSLHPSGNGIPHAGAAENAYVAGQHNVASYLEDRVTVGINIDNIFDAAKTCYQTFSTALSGKADNVRKAISFSQLLVTCNSNTAEEHVLSLTPEEMSQFTYTVTDNCNFQARWVINIRGTTTVTFTGATFPAIPGGVVYNVIGARTINVYNIALGGHLLAPDADLNQESGVIIGKVVANNIRFSLQINSMNTCPVVVPVIKPIALSQPAAAGQVRAHVFGANDLRVNDNTSLGKIVSIVGDFVEFDTPFAHDMSANVVVGQLVLRSDAGRAVYPNPEDSSASTVAVTFAALAVAALLL